MRISHLEEMDEDPFSFSPQITPGYAGHSFVVMSFCSVLQEYAWKVIAKPNEAWAKLAKRSVPARELSLV
jgi:hypothetical protein